MPKSAKLSQSGKPSLVSALQHLLTHTNLRTQAELLSALIDMGFSATQPTVSRALHKLGAIKMQDEHGQSIYRLTPGVSTPTSASQINNMVIDIANSDTFIVIRTTPGSASLIASMLDHHRPAGILGTIAGDDTIFVAPSHSKKIAATVAEISKLLM